MEQNKQDERGRLEEMLEHPEYLDGYEAEMTLLDIDDHAWDASPARIHGRIDVRDHKVYLVEPDGGEHFVYDPGLHRFARRLYTFGLV